MPTCGRQVWPGGVQACSESSVRRPGSCSLPPANAVRAGVGSFHIVVWGDTVIVTPLSIPPPCLTPLAGHSLATITRRKGLCA